MLQMKNIERKKREKRRKKTIERKTGGFERCNDPILQLFLAVFSFVFSDSPLSLPLFLCCSEKYIAVFVYSVRVYQYRSKDR